MQKDLQKKLLDSRQKAKNQLDTNEQSETPESEAVTNLEQFVEQTLLPPTVHAPNRATATKKFKISSSTSSAPAPKTDVPPHNTKTTFSPTAPIRSSNIKSEPRIKTVHQNTSVNPAMKRWVQQRMIEQKQKMRITTTKLKLQDLKHVEIQREDAPLLPHSPISINITTEHLPQAKAPVNRVPNTNWAHVMIKKQQAIFRLKYKPSKTNPKKEIYGTVRIPKTSLSSSSRTKWTSPFPIDTEITAVPIQLQRVSTTSLSSYPFSSQIATSRSDGAAWDNNTSSVHTTAKKPPKVSNQHLTTKSAQPSHSYTPQANAKASRMQHSTAGRQRFFRDWQRKQHIAHVSKRAVPAGSNFLAKAKIIIEKIRVLTTYTSALVVAAIVLLTFLLLFGAVSGLVTSPATIYLPLDLWQPAIGMGHLVA